MRQAMNTTNGLAKAKWMIAVLLMAVADAAAQTQQKAPVPQRQVLVSIPDRKLALIEDGRVLKVYAVAVGADETPSPDGEFKVINRLEKPTYYHKRKVIGPGAANPLGTRWIGLNQEHYGIHGTNEPRSIGKAASHGCIRMAKRDIEELFTLLRVGDPVIIRAESDGFTAQVFRGNTIDAQAQASPAAGSKEM